MSSIDTVSADVPADLRVLAKMAGLGIGAALYIVADRISMGGSAAREAGALTVMLGRMLMSSRTHPDDIAAMHLAIEALS